MLKNKNLLEFFLRYSRHRRIHEPEIVGKTVAAVKTEEYSDEEDEEELKETEIINIPRTSTDLGRRRRAESSEEEEDDLSDDVSFA